MQIILFSSTPFGGTSDSDFKQVGKLVPQGSKFAVQWAPTDSNGKINLNVQTYLSVNTDGTYKTSTVIQAFELFDLIGSSLVIAANLDGQFGGPMYGHVIACRVINV